jgi:RNA polymerase sigma factor (TIGR02999 family)
MDERPDERTHEDESVTTLLEAVQQARPGAEQALFNRVYRELRNIARAQLSGEFRASDQGDPTDLVNDAWLRAHGVQAENRKQLFMLYAATMRRILIDRARARDAQKRGGGQAPISLNGDSVAWDGADGDLAGRIDEHDLVARLRETDAETANVFELRWYGGLAFRHITVVLGTTEHEVRTRWSEAVRLIRSWADADEEPAP